MKIKRLISLIISSIIIFSFVCSGCGNSDEDSFTYRSILKSGATDYCIILPEDTSMVLDFVAEEFNYFLRESTGCELEVISDNKQLPEGIKNYISFGKTKQLLNSALEIDYIELEDDGFAVRYKNGNFYIDSNSERGVLWGCYETLKRYLGIRFLSQTYTHIPKLAEVKFAERDFVCVPDFPQRDILAGYSGNHNYRLTKFGEFGLGGLIDISWATDLGNIHTITDYYVKPSIYRDEHPEFFASYTNDSAKDPEHAEDVCWSNGITDDGKVDDTVDISVAKIVVDTIENNLKENPTRRFYMLGIQDWVDTYCLCDVCNARLERFGERSGITTLFCNAVVNEVNSWIKREGAQYGIDHEVNVIEFAYYWTLNPPVHYDGNGKIVANDALAVPNKNVYIRIAPLNANFAYYYGDSNQTQLYKSLIERWDAISDNLMLYDYCEKLGLFTTWLPHLSFLQKQAQYLKEHDFYYWMYECVYTNNANGLWYMNLFTYVLQNLWWDVNCDVAKIENEFFELYHGKAAAPYVKAFVGLMEENNAILRAKQGYTYGVFGDREISAENYPKALLEKAIELLKNALNAIEQDDSLTIAEKETYSLHVTEALIIPQSMMLLNYNSYYIDGKEELKEEFRINAKSVGLIYPVNGKTLNEWLNNI